MWHPESVFFFASYMGLFIYGLTTLYKVRKVSHYDGSEIIVVLCLVLSLTSALSILAEIYGQAFPFYLARALDTANVAIYFGNRWFHMLLNLFALGYVRSSNGIPAPFLFKAKSPEGK